MTPPGNTPPTALTAARLALHHAAQLVAAAGQALAPKAADDSHRATAWSDDGPAFVGRPLPSGHRVALTVDGALRLVDPRGVVVAETAPAGRPRGEALKWLAAALVDRGAADADLELTLPEWDMPPVGDTLPALDVEAGAELGRWYALGHAILERVRARWPAASPITVWPHHFDIASLVAIDPDPHAPGARSVGVGLSPGDGSYDEPYLYISPYPAPAKLEPLPDVEARAEGWIGYVIRGSTVAAWPADGRAERAAAATLRAVERALTLAHAAGG